jgi:hypothetical protein
MLDKENDCKWMYGEIIDDELIEILMKEYDCSSNRVYKYVDTLAEDYNPGRVNIEIDMNDRIMGVWEG